jgi:uncharacterized membrane protein YcaP (DUF421 family)
MHGYYFYPFTYYVYLNIYSAEAYGKAQIGDMQPFELVITLMIAQVASDLL